MVKAVDCQNALACNLVQQALGTDGNLVGGQIWGIGLIVTEEAFWDLRGNVLPQSSAQGSIYQLSTPADTENRLFEFEKGRE